jgi:hypothetical protein
LSRPCTHCGHEAAHPTHYDGKHNCLVIKCDCPSVDYDPGPETHTGDHPCFCRCARCKVRVDALRAADDEGLIDEDPPPTTKRIWRPVAP